MRIFAMVALARGRTALLQQITLSENMTADRTVSTRQRELALSDIRRLLTSFRLSLQAENEAARTVQSYGRRFVDPEAQRPNDAFDQVKDGLLPLEQAALHRLDPRIKSHKRRLRWPVAKHGRLGFVPV